MKCFHGTVVGNIYQLLPFHTQGANLDKPCVYLSTIESIAAMYIWNKPYKLLIFEFNQAGKPVYVEWFKNGLEFFYKGVSGFIYVCEGDFELVDKVGIQCVVISKIPIPVLDCIAVNDVYDLLLSYERKELLTIQRYHELSDEKLNIIEKNTLSAIHHHKLLHSKHPLTQLIPEKFPKIWAMAKQSNCFK